MAALGGTLKTYNPNLPYTVTTTAATQALIVYAITDAGAQGGITNAAPATNQYFDGITHFKNLCSINGLYAGPAGSEYPVFDKQETMNYFQTVSAGTAIIGVTPFQCTVAGYYCQGNAAPAVPGTITVTTTTGGDGLLTYSPASAGNAGDTFQFALGTGNTGGTFSVAGGTPLSLSFSGSGTAWITQCTVVLTRTGI